MREISYQFILLCIFLLTINSCYYLNQAAVLMRHRSQSRSFEQVLEHEDSEELRSFFDRVEGIRSFGSSVLGLELGKSYSRYLEVENDYLVAVVNATSPDSISPYLWCYPFFGPAPYRGYYNPEHARREASRLEEKGYDVWIREVDAFSTLGFTADPVISFMRDYDDFELARLIFHEQIHATLWIKGHIQFNEELANALGDAAALEYLEARTAMDAYVQAQNRIRDSAQFAKDMALFAAELDEFYEKSVAYEREALKEGKAELYRSFARSFKEGYDERYRTQGYSAMSGMEINNAFVSLFRTYSGRGETYQRLCEKIGSVRESLEVLESRLNLKENRKKDPYEVLLDIMEEE